MIALRRRAALILALTLSAGCGSPTSPESHLEVLYRTSGGLTGAEDTTEVWSDGRVTFTTSWGVAIEGQGEPALLADVRRLVHSPDFRTLARSYVTHDCCDIRYLHFVVDHGDVTQVVDSEAGRLQPAVLFQATRALRALVEELGQGPPR